MGKIKKIIEWWNNKKYWQRGAIIGVILGFFLFVLPQIFYADFLWGLIGENLFIFIFLMIFGVIKVLAPSLIIGAIIGWIVGKFKKEKKKKRKIPLTFIIVPLIIILILIFFVSAFIRPIGGMITEDRPILSSLCNAQIGCKNCEKNNICLKKLDNLPENINLREYIKEKNLNQYVPALMEWEGYHGCNESTKGYYQLEGLDYVKVVECCCN